MPLNIIQCRFNSSRLPGKALYPLAGIPMLVFLIRRLKQADLPGTLVLATTKRRDDDIIAVWGQMEDVPVVRGSDEDVLSRYLKCLALYPSRFVIRITADNPLTDPYLISQVSQEMKRDHPRGGCVNPHRLVGVAPPRAGALDRMVEDVMTESIRDRLDQTDFLPEKWANIGCRALAKIIDGDFADLASLNLDIRVQKPRSRFENSGLVDPSAMFELNRAILGVLKAGRHVSYHSLQHGFEVSGCGFQDLFNSVQTLQLLRALAKRIQ